MLQPDVPLCWYLEFHYADSLAIAFLHNNMHLINGENYVPCT
jgi:hypothetical protein